jgi:hypothetical protein
MRQLPDRPAKGTASFEALSYVLDSILPVQYGISNRTEKLEDILVSDPVEFYE